MQFYLLNYFPETKTVTVVLDKDGVVLRKDQLIAAPGKSLETWKGLPASGSGLYEIRFENSRDSFSLAAIVFWCWSPHWRSS